MKYTKNETVKNWKDGSDRRLYEKYFGALCEWEPVERLDELISLLDSFAGNKEFEKYFSHCEYGIDVDFEYNKRDIPILHGALDAFDILDHIPYYYPSIRRHLVVVNSIIALRSAIQLAFVHYNNRLLTLEDDKVIITSDIFYYMTFFVEDYDNPDNEYVDYGYEYYKDFFKRARKTYWADKKTKKLYKAILDLTTTTCGAYYWKSKNQAYFDVHNLTTMAAIYLMVCNAFKNGRDAVTSEDVVVGYLTIFKMIFNDVRPLVYKLYDEEKWGKVDKKIKKYKPLDKSPFENIKQED